MDSIFSSVWTILAIAGALCLPFWIITDLLPSLIESLSDDRERERRRVRMASPDRSLSMKDDDFVYLGLIGPALGEKLRDTGIWNTLIDDLVGIRAAMLAQGLGDAWRCTFEDFAGKFADVSKRYDIFATHSENAKPGDRREIEQLLIAETKDLIDDATAIKVSYMPRLTPEVKAELVGSRLSSPA